MLALLQRKSLRFLHPFLRRLVRYYLRKPRSYRFQSLRLTIYPSVFHPGLFYSTQYLIAYLSEIDLSRKRLLELGAGSGLISMVAASRGATVTSTDINTQALEGIRENAATNKLDIEVKESDLFDKVEPQRFDMIIINPPYYPKAPQNTGESAWFCGENFEYFEKLFRQLENENLNDIHILMVLSEDCDITRIGQIGSKAGITLNEVSRKEIGGELNFIFRLKKSQVHS